MPETAFVVGKIEVAQAASFGPYKLNVIEPVGLYPPASVAVSEMEPEIATVGEATVEMVGLALLTVSVSPESLHLPEIPSL